MKEVTAAIIKREVDARMQILICQRAADDECGLLWEFPGGKLEDGETKDECIRREIKEELEIEIEPVDIFMTNLYRFRGLDIFFTVFNAVMTGGKVRLNVHNDAKWIFAEDLDRYDFMPPDIVFVEELKRQHKI